MIARWRPTIVTESLNSSTQKQKDGNIGNSTLLVAPVFSHIQMGEKECKISSAEQRMRNMCIPPPLPAFPSQNLPMCQREGGMFLRALSITKDSVLIYRRRLLPLSSQVSLCPCFRPLQQQSRSLSGDTESLEHRQGIRALCPGYLIVEGSAQFSMANDFRSRPNVASLPPEL